jgi:hypothetical protein
MQEAAGAAAADVARTAIKQSEKNRAMLFLIVFPFFHKGVGRT